MENKNYDDVLDKKPYNNYKNNNNNNNTFMIFLLIAIIFISELFLFNYLQTSITSDISVNYVAKNDLEGMFRDILISDEDFRSILRVLVREDSSDNFNRRKRGALVVDDDNMVTSQTYPGIKEGQTVEFFNPKLRHELEAKDEVERSRTGNKGAAPGGDSWVWLTSYCRIPLKAIQGYCSATKEYCPQAPHGPPGLPGVSGPKGDRGDTGLPGIPGPAGIRGPRGPPGEVGWPGSPGLDGRDGVPGEPGLDGVPGRSGLDGIPGMNGLPGQDGRPGVNGINGTDGKPGLRGPQGPPGPKGERGNYGPKGRPGRPGINGTPGNPGISTYKVPGRNLSELLIPPSIAGSKTVLGNRPIVVHEGENVRMRCAATGVPKPAVEWRKADGSAIPLGSWQTVSVSGYYLNLTRVNRGHMGTYQCVADNGIGPAANQTFRLEVHFPPLIRIRNQMVGAANTTTAILECEVEAFPEAVRYWERSDGRLLEHSSKYRVDNSFERDGYKAVMQLRIVNVSGPDFMRYHCIAKNEHGITRGEFTLYEVDPRLVTPPPVVEGSGVAIYGVQPPESKSLDDLCPPPIQCPECPDPKELKCPNPGVSYLDLMGKLVVRPFGNDTYPGIPNRATDCVLYAVGKPVYHRFTEQTYGCWMRDPLPPTEAASEKFWVTRENSSYYLYEFENKAMFRKDTPTKRYVLEHQFRGNSHVIFNGSFFYNKRDRPAIMKFDLATERYHSLEVPMVATNGTNFLYTTEYNYMDFNVDDNGLWVIYGIPTSNNTVVMKVDANHMTVQYMWNISINHHKVGEMFIVCGVLYGVDSITDRNTKIRMALDLYKNSPIDVNLSFTNPFRKSTMIGYNFRTKELYTWDKGNQLTYPIRYHEMGYNMSKEEKQENADFLNAQMHTGVDIYN